MARMEAPAGGVPTTQAYVDPDYPLAHVPSSARRSFWSILVVLLGFTVFSSTMLAGAQVGVAFGFSDFLKLAVIASVILGVYVAALSWIGAGTGLTTVLLSRYALGNLGAKWADLLLGGTQVGWYGVTVALLSVGVAQAFNWHEYLWLLHILGGVLMGVTAYYGYRGMEVLSGASVPLLTILCIWVTARAFGEAGGMSGMLSIPAAGGMAAITAITIMVGTFVSGGTQAPNWTRFARTSGQGFWAAFVAWFIGNGAMLFFGAVGAIAFQEPDFVLALYKMGLITWGVILLILNLWTTNDNAAYAFGVAGAEFFNVPDKRPFIIGGVVIGIILALTGIYDFLINYLILLSVFIPPLGGAIIGDYLFVWKRQLPDLETVTFRQVRWSGVVAYLLGTLAAWLGNTYEFGIPPLQGIIVAAVMVPVMEALFRALGIADQHQVGGAAG